MCNLSTTGAFHTPVKPQPAKLMYESQGGAVQLNMGYVASMAVKKIP